MPNFLMKSPRLLIVDDHPESLEVLLAWLAPRKTKVYQASSGEQALKILAKKQVDAVITDWLLPGLSGVELVSSLRASGFNGPLLICTGSMLDAEHLQEAFDAGANDYLRKPMNQVEFNARLDKSLSWFAQRYTLERFSDSQHQLMVLMSEQLGGDLQSLIQMQELEKWDPSSLERFQNQRHDLTKQLKDRFTSLMNWSRYRFALQQLQPEPLQLRGYFKNLLSQIGPAGERVQISAARDLQVISDAEILRRALLALIDNALRHCPGEVLLKAQAQDGVIRMCVLDEGDLSEGAIDRLLAGQGIGLGLRICHDLLALLGSRLQAAPRRGQRGSQFYFDLPL